MDMDRIGLSIGMFIFGILAFSIFLINCEGSVVYEAHQLKQECEETLPRNQYCELAAIPKSRAETPENVTVE